jgi:hypothetical protein
MDTTIEEKLCVFAPTVMGYYNWEHLSNDLPTIEEAFVQGVIMAYQMMHGMRDPEELAMFHKIMDKHRFK